MVSPRCNCSATDCRSEYASYSIPSASTVRRNQTVSSPGSSKTSVRMIR